MWLFSHLWLSAIVVVTFPIATALLVGCQTSQPLRSMFRLLAIVSALVAALSFTGNAYHIRSVYLNWADIRWTPLLIGLVWSGLLIMPTIAASLLSKGTVSNQLLIGVVSTLR